MEVENTTFGVEFCIKNHLVFNALKNKLISQEDLLSYLQCKPVTDDNLIAYRHAILFDSSSNQEVNGCHFLIGCPIEYGAVYALSDMPLLIQVFADDEEKKDAGNYIYRGVMLLHKDPVFSDKIKLICDKDCGSQVRMEDITLMIRSRSEKVFSALTFSSTNTILNILLRCDWIEMFDLVYHPSFLNNLLDRCKDIAQQIPAYWQVMADKYKKYLTKCFKEGLIFPSKELPTCIKEVFPDFFPYASDFFSDLAWFIYLLPLRLQGYLLGYPIHHRVPSHEELIPSLLIISKDGIDGYIARYKAGLVDSLKQPPNPVFGSISDLDQVNTKDSLEEDIFDYPIFDIIPFFENNKIYYFTRPEFETLYEKKKNIWTNVDLTSNMYHLIAMRETLAEKLYLPPSAPMKDLLENVTESKLVYIDGVVAFTHDEEEGEEEDNTESSVISLPPNISQVLMSYLMGSSVR